MVKIAQYYWHINADNWSNATSIVRFDSGLEVLVGQSRKTDADVKAY